jgi:hypothetical protein
VIRRLYRTLPGPTPARMVQMVLIAAALLTALLFAYEWLGTTFLDPGGTIG